MEILDHLEQVWGTTHAEELGAQMDEWDGDPEVKRECMNPMHSNASSEEGEVENDSGRKTPNNAASVRCVCVGAPDNHCSRCPLY